jgi:FAD-NAD(P)-binding
VSVFMPEPVLLNSPRGRPWPRLAAPVTAADGPLPASADVAIVGAGPAGLAVTGALWHLGVRDIVVLDRDGRPGGRFFDRIDTLRQRVLRSPYGHHPGVEGYRDCELLDFARLHWAYLTPVERREIRMAQAGHRSVVPVDVFQAYCQHLAAVHGLTERIWRTGVTRIDPRPSQVAVSTARGAVLARFVVLCLGEERREAPPGWWPPGQPPPAVSHWDEPLPAGLALTVIGAGLSAAHLISNALSAGRRVHWVVRQAEERYQCNDVNAAFFRAEGRARFTSTIPWADRLAVMRRERRASVMFEFRPQLRAAESAGRLVVHRGRPVTAIGPRPGVTRLADGIELLADHVVLALGTAPATGGGLLPAHILGDVDGWPDLDDRTLAYRQAPRVYAVGASAGMILGPAARNIDGHRVATARVATAIASQLGDDSARTHDREVIASA